jgi:ligand-binding SRPBCC domain-containing protein
MIIFFDPPRKHNNFNKIAKWITDGPLFELLSAAPVVSNMHFQIRTAVQGSPRSVFARFNRTLFMALAPPGVRLHLYQFDEPIAVGGVVHLEVKFFGLIRQEWYNRITAVELTDTQCAFVDEGERLPAPLRGWRHHHIIRQGSQGTEIVDDITYHASNGLLSLLMLPAVYLQFWIRKPVYRRFFRL